MYLFWHKQEVKVDLKALVEKDDVLSEDELYNKFIQNMDDRNK